MNYKRFQVYFFLGICAVALVLTFLVYRPYVSLIVFSGVLAILTWPAYSILLKLFRGQKTLAAASTVILTMVMVVLPLSLLVISLATEAAELFGRYRSQVQFDDISGTLARIIGPTQAEAVAREISSGVTNIASYLQPAFTKLTTNIFALFSNTVAVIFGIFLVLMSMYYMLKDGADFKQTILALSPLNDEDDLAIYDRIRDAVRAVAFGAFTVSISKGVLGGLIFFLVGIKAPVFWGTMIALAHFVPGLGTALVTTPFIVYLLVTGHVWQGLLLLGVSVVLIGLVDNFLSPQIIKARIKIHPLLILFSILGGLQFFGGFGVFFGPIILAVTVALIDIYKKEFREVVEKLK